MADAGADLIVAHMGVTTGGSIGARSSKTLDDCVARIQDIADAARGVNPDVLVICHGGPISEPPDAEYIIKNCRGVDGFYGASSVERLPAERAIADQIRTFKGRPAFAPGASAGNPDGARQAHMSAAAAKKALRFVTATTARVELAPWGKHWWLSEPELTGTKLLTLVRVTMRPGTGHRFHYHPTREEIIYVVDGVAEQWVGPGEAPAESRRMRVHPAERRARDLQLIEEANDVPGDPVAGEGQGPLSRRLLRRGTVAEPAAAAVAQGTLSGLLALRFNRGCDTMRTAPDPHNTDRRPRLTLIRERVGVSVRTVRDSCKRTGEM